MGYGSKMTTGKRSGSSNNKSGTQKSGAPGQPRGSAASHKKPRSGQEGQPMSSNKRSKSRPSYL